MMIMLYVVDSTASRGWVDQLIIWLVLVAIEDLNYDLSVGPWHSLKTTIEGYILQSICRFCKMFNFKFKFSVSITSGNVQIFVLKVAFTRYMMNVSCGNTEFKCPNKNKTFPDSQGRAALFAGPFLQNLKCKFPQNFHFLTGISPKLR